jgi:hypothetical protein
MHINTGASGGANQIPAADIRREGGGDSLTRFSHWHGKE